METVHITLLKITLVSSAKYECAFANFCPQWHAGSICMRFKFEPMGLNVDTEKNVSVMAKHQYWLYDLEASITLECYHAIFVSFKKNLTNKITS